MNKFVPILLIITILIIGTISLEIINLLNQRSNNIVRYTLFPGYTTSFSIIGSYLSDSEYAMAEIYSKNASLMVSPFLWNVNYALGEVNMTFNKFLYVSINLTGVQKINYNIPVDGYPGLMYGQEYWFPFATHTEELKTLSLPMIVSNLPSFYSILNYSLYNNTGQIDDFSYDIWLSKNPLTTSLTYGDFEVMIWMYWTENLSSPFVYAGNLTIPILINGSIYNYSWKVYVLPRTGSSNGWTSIYFLSPIQLKNGVVGIPISYVLKNLNPFLNKVGINFYNDTQYYLDAIQIGMEFNDNLQGNVNVGYYLYSWQILIEN
jgi:hypothetical protein